MLKPFKYLFKGSLVLRILIAVILASVSYAVFGSAVGNLAFLGDTFVGLLKAIAPLLVFVLIISSITQAESGLNSTIRLIVFLYVFSTVIGAFISTGVTFLAPAIKLDLGAVDASSAADLVAKGPSSAMEVLKIQFLNLFMNPVAALAQGNFLAVLVWAVVFGLAFRRGGKRIKDIIEEMSNALSRIVGWIVQLAPFGVYGILCGILAEHGVAEILHYGELILLLLGVFGLLIVVFFPVMGFCLGAKNPIRLWFKCLSTSGVSAFFSRSSAANIPVNLDLCKQWRVPRTVAAFTIPLGANINLIGASCTITVLSITAAHSLGVEIHFAQAILSCVVAAVCALGASGIPGGSLIMIPIAASLFGISPDISSKMIAIGFLIGIIQDSVETAINSAGDLYYTIIACERANLYEGDEVEGLPADVEVNPHGQDLDA